MNNAEGFVMRNLESVANAVMAAPSRGRPKDADRKYDYFKKVINLITIPNDHCMITISKILCRRNTIKDYEDVSVIANDVKSLVKRYNDDVSNKYEITCCSDTPKVTKYYLNFKPSVKNEEPVQIDLLVEDKPVKEDRDKWCINWAINTIVSKFKELGFGSQFRARDLVGKTHPYCEKTKYCITHSHVAEARRIINKNCTKYGFCVSDRYVIYPADSNVGWR